MKTLQQLRESLNSPAKLDWTVKSGYLYGKAMMKNGQPFNIQMGLHDESHVSFYVSGTTKITNKGNAQEVFATVIAAFDHYIKNYGKPESFLFTVFKNQGGDSRMKLYKSLLEKYASSVGYRYQEEQQTKLVIDIRMVRVD